MNNVKESTLTIQQQALTQYLDSLLMEIPDPTSQEVVTQASELPSENTSVVTLAPLVTTEKGAVNVAFDDEAIHETKSKDGAGSAEVPEWAVEPFKVLYFNVGEMKLAAPLDKFGGVVTDYGEIKALPGTASYYLGVILHGGHTVRVIDFHCFVANGNDNSIPQLPAEPTPFNRIILVKGKNIGIACRSVSEVEEIASDEIRWRTGLTKRAWYRGIVTEKMCALLDIDAMLSIVNSDTHNA